MAFLPTLMATITQKPRHKVDIVWSDKSWVHNIFRVWEMIFWRREGIRAEMATSCDPKGNVTVNCYSFESICAFAETCIRRKLPRFEFQRFYVPAFAGTGMMGAPKMQILLAIAADAAAFGSQLNGSSLTYSHTCTGTNLLLWVTSSTNAGDGANHVNSVTYNAVDMGAADITGTQFSGTSDIPNLRHLIAPATGANNVVVSTGAGQDIYAVASSYSGCKQSGQPDATASAQASVTATATINVVASNCWVIGGCSDSSQGTPKKSTGLVSYRPAIEFESCTADTNATVATGNNSIAFTSNNGGASNVVMVCASFPPSAAVAANNPAFLINFMT